MAAESSSGPVPKLVLIPHERSHVFLRRECVLSEPLKVGRSVDKGRISQKNLIFDCRVLSRNHALIWFRNGKFYIQDTKSSNGTFVNETRLSPSGEESGPVELKSRDIVQFGVNVNVEKKVTHGCIIGTIQLYINGEELPGVDPPVQQVMHLLQSALSREQELEHKLGSMQEVLNAARQLTTESMIAIVREDELMSRLEMLENQLQVYSRNASEDELKKQLEKAFEEKHKSEANSKNSIRAILQEKSECVTKLSQLQRDYDKAEQECQKNKTLHDAAKKEHSDEVGTLMEQLRNAEKECKAAEKKLADEKKTLSASIETLQSEVEYTRSQLQTTKARAEEMEEELVTLKIKEEARKQRKAAGLVSSPEDSLEIGGNRESEDGEDSFKILPEQSLVPHQVVVKETAVPLGAGPPGEDHSGSEDERESDSARLLELEMQVTALEEQLKLSEGEVSRLNEQLSQQTGGGDAGPFQSSLAEAEEHIRSLQVELQAETEKRLALHERATALNGQLCQCYSELEGRHVAVCQLQDAVREKEDIISEMQKDIDQSRTQVTRLNGSMNDLREQLSSVQTESESKCLKLRTENQELLEEVRRLEVRLGEEQEAREKDKAKPHFLLRPGSPTADEQRVKLLTIIALVAIGAAVAQWLF